MIETNDGRGTTLDVGCGKAKLAGAIGIDHIRLPGVDVIANLDSTALPFVANVFNTVYCSHVLEHLADWTAMLREIKRVLRPGGTIYVRVPYFASAGSFRDPTHKHFFTFDTFDYFSDDSQNALSVLSYYYPDLRFIVKKHLTFSRLHRLLGAHILFNLFPRFYESYLCYIIPAREVFATLRIAAARESD